MEKKYILIYFILFTAQLQAQSGLDQILLKSITEKGVDYKHLKMNEESFSTAVEEFISAEFMSLSIEGQVAAYMNAYNLIVLKEITRLYPISSVKEDASFFDRKHSVFGAQKSLNEIEKYLLELKKDPRIHFLLVCGAKSCPQLSPQLISMGNLDETLENATIRALQSPHMLSIDEEKKEIKLNAIFNWFSSDFGGSPEEFLSPYFPAKDVSAYKMGTQKYDWALNSVDPVPNTKRYVATRLYSKGQFELHVFNNYYTQKETGNFSDFNFGRHNFHTILTALTVGINNRLNAGIGIKARSVYQDRLSTDGIFKALEFKNEGPRIDDMDLNTGYTRTGITAVYPFIKYAPFASHSNISITHTLFIPTGDNLEGAGSGDYIDWDNVSLFNQLFYTKPFGLNKELFMDIGLQIENAGGHLFDGSAESGFTQIGFPVTAIINLFPKGGLTYYGLINVAPRLTISSNGSKSYSGNAFGQVGGGVKYFVSSNLELEGLYTLFLDTTDNRIAHTFNIGLRYIRR